MSTLRRNEAALSDTAFLYRLNGVAHNAAMLGQLTSVLEIQITTIQDKQRIHSLDLLAQDTQTLAAKKRAELQSFLPLVGVPRTKEMHEIDAYMIEISCAGFLFWFAQNSHLVIGGILCSISDRLQLSLFSFKDSGGLIVVNQIFWSFFRINFLFKRAKWITGKLSQKIMILFTWVYWNMWDVIVHYILFPERDWVNHVQVKDQGPNASSLILV